MLERKHIPCLLLALSAMLVGCGALAPVAAQPQVTVNTVSLSSASFTGIRGEVAMDVYNPNGFGLPLTRVDWSLSVGSAQAVSGTFDLSDTIPAKASAPVTGSLTIDAAAALGVASQLAAGARTYTLRGTLHFQTRFGNLSVDIAGEGQIANLM